MIATKALKVQFMSIEYPWTQHKRSMWKMLHYHIEEGRARPHPSLPLLLVISLDFDGFRHFIR